MHSKTKIIGLSLVACLGLVTSAAAGLIGPVVDQASPAHSSGYGGWNLDNVDVKITDLDYANNGKNFNTVTGSYDTMELGDSFESDIKDNVTGEVLVNLHGKDWPVGEPAGIKVLNADDANATLKHSKPASCIMTTSYFDVDPLENTEGDLSKATPTETLCDSAFQSHKRFKLNMLPSMVAGKAQGDYAAGVNLTFNVTDDAAGQDTTRRYQILQKANNYTGVRLDGYKVEVGFVDDLGNFKKASDVVGGADIRLSIGKGEQEDGSDIWKENELATFSHGLWGPADGDHFPHDGFFQDVSAGYVVELAATKDTITSVDTLGSNYVDLFGQWLPSEWAPEGIFFDEDGDPTTDATVLAYWADPGDGNYTWVKGNEDGFAKATEEELALWAGGYPYFEEEIEDVLNLGLNYIVEVGDVSTFPVQQFTIRLTPHIAADQTAPGYVIPLGDNDSSKGIFSTMDNMSLFAMIFGFLAIGGLIARKKLAKQ